jgi:hypothetical protein
MKDQKKFIGGWVDAKLKSRFLKELQKLNKKTSRDQDGKITQSKFLEMLLTESVIHHQEPGQPKKRPTASM